MIVGLNCSNNGGSLKILFTCTVQIDVAVVGSSLLNVLDRLAFEVLTGTTNYSTENICKSIRIIRIMTMSCQEFY